MQVIQSKGPLQADVIIGTNMKRRVQNSMNSNIAGCSVV